MKQDIQDIENEEEVLMRQDEFMKHPLWDKLKEHSLELADFIK